MSRHIHPMAVGILDAMIGILIRFGIDLGVKPCLLQSPLDVVEIVDLEAEMIDALFLVVAFGFDERYIHVAIGHINSPAEAALGLQSEYLLIELHHFFAILCHHRNMSNFRAHFPTSVWSKVIEFGGILPLDLSSLRIGNFRESAVEVRARRRPSRTLQGEIRRPKNIGAAWIFTHAQAFLIVPTADKALPLEQLRWLKRISFGLQAVGSGLVIRVLDFVRDPAKRTLG